MKLNYIFIPLVVIIIAVVGSLFTSAGMGWYKTISLPSWTPSGVVIGIAWTIIFILSTISALIFWNRGGGAGFKLVAAIFIINGALNVSWTILFFHLHFLKTSIWEAGLLGISVAALIVLLWRRARFAAYLLVPYVAWTAFATYLTYVIWFLNS